VNEAFDHEVDVLIVASGNGALTSALTCYELGVTDVLVVEKGEKMGGTSAFSGGGVWIPCNRYAKEAGAEDSLEDAREYLRRYRQINFSKPTCSTK
jgi:3-oxosteroid 1-dehydrogenase